MILQVLLEVSEVVLDGVLIVGVYLYPHDLDQFLFVVLILLLLSAALRGFRTSLLADIDPLSDVVDEPER